MTADEWEKVTDQEFIEEMSNRSLEQYVHCECEDEIEAALADVWRPEHDNSVDNDDLRRMAEMFKSGNREALDRALGDVFYDVLGIIV